MYLVRGRIKLPDTSTETGAYILGVLWGTCSRNIEGYLIRHRTPWFVNCVKEYMQIPNSPYILTARTGDQTILKITKKPFVRQIDHLLIKQGWQPRNAAKRSYPYKNIDDKGFVRAWIELRSSIDIARIGTKRIATPRIRIYGNEELIEKINTVLSAGTGLKPRTLQKTTNEITKALYYCGSSAQNVYDWLYTGPALYCADVRENFERYCFKATKNRGEFKAGGRN